MVKFCPKCGNQIELEESQFCPKCGTKQPIASLEPTLAQPGGAVCKSCGNPIKSGDIYCSKCLGSVLQPQSPTKDSTKKKTSTRDWIVLCCGGIIVLILIFGGYNYVVHHGGLVGMATGNSQDTRDKIVSKDFSAMALTINDLPTGWKTDGTPIITNDTYSSRFIKIEYLTPYVVYLHIYRYPTVDLAKSGYLAKKAEITDYKVESVNIGNEGFGYVNSDSSIVVFRQGNIIVRTQYGVGGFGGSPYLSINDAKDYATIVEGRIN